MGSVGYVPLGSEFDMAPRLPPDGWRGWWGGKIVTVLKGGSALAVAATSAAIRLRNLHPIANGLSSIGIGCGFQAIVSTFIPDAYTSRVQQVFQTVFGQTALFLISQLVVNFPETETASLAIIGAMLGVNLAIWGKQFIDSRFGLSDSTPPEAIETTGAKLQCFSFSPLAGVHYPLKIIAAVGCLMTWMKSTDPVIQGLASFGACYYAIEPLAQRALSAVDRQIAKTKRAAQDGISHLQHSYWRLLKVSVNTLSYLMIPIAMVPWDEPRTTARSLQLWATGFFIGLCDGFLFRTQEKELRKTNIDQIAALKSRTPVQSTAFRVWRVAWPILIFGSITTFVISQLMSNESDIDKIAMGTMYLGYLYACAKSLAIGQYWNLQKRCEKLHLTLWDRWVDGRVVSQILPRIAAINPIYVYYALTNSIAMHGDQHLKTSYKILLCLAWFFYGKGMGTEFEQTWGENRGTIFRFPTMLFVNAILTTAAVLRREIA